MTTRQRNARTLARTHPGGVIHTRTPDVDVIITKVMDVFDVRKQYANGETVWLKALSGAGVLDELDRMNISIGG